MSCSMGTLDAFADIITVKRHFPSSFLIDQVCDFRMSEEVPERKLFSSFDKYGEFVDAQGAFLAVDLFNNPSTEDDHKECLLLKELSNIVRLWIFRILVYSEQETARQLSGTILSVRSVP